jgi:hypothetical protein
VSKVRLCTLLLTVICLSIYWTYHMYTHDQAPALRVQFLCTMLSFSAVFSWRPWGVSHVSLLLHTHSSRRFSLERQWHLQRRYGIRDSSIWHWNWTVKLHVKRYFWSRQRGYEIRDCFDVFGSLVLLRPSTLLAASGYCQWIDMASTTDRYRIRQSYFLLSPFSCLAWKRAIIRSPSDHDAALVW